MAIDLLPEKWNLPSVLVGDTLPATNFLYPGSGTLSRVRLKVKDDAGVAVLSLDSDTSGLTINAAGTGGWDWDMDEVSAATTAGITAGDYKYDMETITSAGTVRTLIYGNWCLTAQITD
jgi:hypothetical protein